MTEMWKEGDKIILSECLLWFSLADGAVFVRKQKRLTERRHSHHHTATKVKERQSAVLAAAAATLVNPGTPLKAKL